jgi:hypothetical protein
MEMIGEGATAEAVVEMLSEAYKTCPDYMQPVEWAVEYQTVQAGLLAYLWTVVEHGETVATELPFEVSIRNPETGGISTKYKLCGKIDKIVRRGDRLFVKEHKTTKDNIEPGSDYWAERRLDSQISLYVMAARQLGYAVEGVLFDAFHKPGISPKKLTQADSKPFLAGGNVEYCGQTFGVTADGSTVVVGEEAAEVDATGKAPIIRETPAMFGARLLQELMAKPGYYFQCIEVARTDADIEAAQYELWATMQTINSMRTSGHWITHEQSCTSRGRCPYTTYCFNGIDPGDGPIEGFVAIDDLHPELRKETENV